MPQKKPILSVTDLSISFGKNTVIHNISYQLNQNEILGIVGESGSGKSVSSLAILGLLPPKISKINSGSIIYAENDLTKLTSKAFRSIRGKKIAIIGDVIHSRVALSNIFCLQKLGAKVKVLHWGGCVGINDRADAGNAGAGACRNYFSGWNLYNHGGHPGVVGAGA